MDSNKLISLSKKLSPMLKGKPLSTICGLIMSETHYLPVKQVLSGEEILILTFLIKGQNQTNDADLLYKHITNNLYVFSLLEVTGDEVEDECNRCNGDGRTDCYSCDGSGEEDCSNCGGSGEDDEEPCDYCQGDGQITCDNCSGDGIESCDYCDGSGYVVIEDYLPFRQGYFASLDSKLYPTLEVMSEEEEVPDNLLERVYDSKNTFLFNETEGSSDSLPIGPNESMFVGIAKGDLRFTKGHNLEDRNLLSY